MWRYVEAGYVNYRSCNMYLKHVLTRLSTFEDSEGRTSVLVHAVVTPAIAVQAAGFGVV
jgi:hypothetical protein